MTKRGRRSRNSGVDVVVPEVERLEDVAIRVHHVVRARHGRSLRRKSGPIHITEMRFAGAARFAIHRDRGLPVPPDPRRVSVDMILEALLAEYRTNGRRSIDRADLSCRHLKRFFGGRSAVTVRGVDVVGYADLRLQEKTAVATVNRELAALRRAFRLAIRQGLLITMPPITTLREDNVRTGFFEADQFEAVCRRLRDTEVDIARFCYHTGWRTKSEVFPLTWAQVDWTGGLVRLEPGTTKNREGRAFPITPALRAILERRLDYTRRCERAQGRIIPCVSTERACRSSRWQSRGGPPAKRRARLDGCSMIFGAPRPGISNVRACHVPWP